MYSCTRRHNITTSQACQHEKLFAGEKYRECHTINFYGMPCMMYASFHVATLYRFVNGDFMRFGGVNFFFLSFGMVARFPFKMR